MLRDDHCPVVGHVHSDHVIRACTVSDLTAVHKAPLSRSHTAGPFGETSPRTSVPGDENNRSSATSAVKLGREQQKNQASSYLWLWPIYRNIYISRPRLKRVYLVSLFVLTLLPGGALSPLSHVLHETSPSNFFPEYILCVRHGDKACQWGYRVPVSWRWPLIGFL